jgi:hypothetical protein
VLLRQPQLVGKDTTIQPLEVMVIGGGMKALVDTSPILVVTTCIRYRQGMETLARCLR